MNFNDQSTTNLSALNLRIKEIVNKILKNYSNNTKKHAYTTITQNYGYSNTEIPVKKIMKAIFLAMESNPGGRFVISSNRQNWISNKLCDYMKPQLSTTSRVVDFGGGDGHVLANFGQYFGISPENLICVEQSANDWSESYSHPNESAITYLEWNNIHANIPDNSIDLAIIMVSLHHMSDETIKSVIKNVKRILKPTGTVLIKEHDIRSNLDMVIVEWEHHLWHLCETSATSTTISADLDDYLGRTYIANFKSRAYFNKLLSTSGFFHIVSKTATFDAETEQSYNPTNLYWQVWHLDSAYI